MHDSLKGEGVKVESQSRLKRGRVNPPYMKDSIKSARARNRVNVPEKNKKSPVVPVKLLPAPRVLCRSDRRGVLRESRGINPTKLSKLL